MATDVIVDGTNILSAESIAKYSDGSIAACYMEYSNPNYSIAVAKSSDNGATWGAPTLVLTSTTRPFTPVIVIDSNDIANILFRQANKIYHTYEDGVGGWTAQVLVDDTVAWDEVHVAVDSLDNLHCVFGDQAISGGGVAYKKYTFATTTWDVSKTTLKAPDVGKRVSDPRIAVDSSNNLHVLFRANGIAGAADASSPNICYMKYTDSWSGITLVTDMGASTLQQNPRIAIDSSDNLYAIWRGTGHGSNPSVNNIRFSKTTSGTWDAHSAVTDESYSVSSFSYLALAIDQNEVVHVTWSGYDASEDYELLYHRQYLSGVWLDRETLLDDSSISVANLSYATVWDNHPGNQNVIADGYALLITYYPDVGANTVKFYSDAATSTVKEYISDAVARVSSIRHILRPGRIIMQVGVDDLGIVEDPIADVIRRRELDTRVLVP